jgi:predicted ATPase
MRRFILTGTPGSGKTAIIRQLELDGFSLVEEAATDIMALEQAWGVAEPWTHATFVASITELERRRRRASRETDEVEFHDPSVICIAALAVYLGYPFRPCFARAEACRNRGDLSEASLLHTESRLHHADRSAADQL